MQLYFDVVHPKLTNRLFEVNRTPIDVVPLLLEKVDDILRRDRTEETITFAHTNLRGERRFLQLSRLLLRTTLFAFGRRFVLTSLCFELRHVRVAGQHRLAIRDEEITRISRSNLDDLARLSEGFNISE